MRLWRVLPHDPAVGADAPGGGLWIPRARQGGSRHDNPDAYGCLYASQSPVSTIAEALAPFRGAGPLGHGMLKRAGVGLALAEISFAGKVLDLDDPDVLASERLHPSQIATRRRDRTQVDALRLHAAHPSVGALRWWSTLEASWLNVTVFDRALPQLHLRDVRPLHVEQPDVHAAATFLGLR